jgi:nitrate reductase gamma subunit
VEELMNLSKLAYRPVGLGASLAAGAVASAVFKLVWRRVADEEEAPSALESEYSMSEVVLAAAIQGLIFAAVKAFIDRSGAHLFQRLTGSWPGN